VRGRQSPVSCGDESVVIGFPGDRSAIGLKRGRSRFFARLVLTESTKHHARPKMALRHTKFVELLRLYFAARSFGGSGATGSGSGGRAGAPPENRAMSQERNNATASLLQIFRDGW